MANSDNNARILIVEDEAIIAKDLQWRLEQLGYTVPHIVSRGEEAIDKVGENNVDLILMDILLKGELDGIDAAAQIHEKANIPIVYLTAYADDAILERAKITEPFGYMIKPVGNRELHSTIEMALYKHNMDRTLRIREKWFHTVLKSIGDAVIATDAKGTVTLMNSVAESLTGWRKEEAKGKDLREIYIIEDENSGEKVENPVEKILKHGVIIGLANHTVLTTKDNRKIPIDDSGAPIMDEKGNIMGVVLVFHDISERKKREEEIERAKVEWEMTFDNATELITLIDNNLDIVRCNRSFAEFVKKPINAIIGHKCTEFLPCDDSVFKQPGSKSNIAVRTDTGRWLYLSFCPIKNERGEFMHAIVISTDITELKNTQQRLMESEEELKGRVRDLENFYEMAVGRELKMKDLKNEVARLTELLAESKKHKTKLK